jgi:alpha-tubulin suppressor-like RCC1 family protein
VWWITKVVRRAGVVSGVITSVAAGLTSCVSDGSSTNVFADGSTSSDEASVASDSASVADGSTTQDASAPSASSVDSGCGDTMTSHDNCGKCGNVCSATVNCFDGICDGDKLVDVAAGSLSACAVTKSGAVFCWGDNAFDELGASSGANTCTGGTACSPKALRVVGLNDAVRVDVGDQMACAVHSSGGVACWGRNNIGQLGHSGGDGSCAGVPCNIAPTPVVGLPGTDPVVQVVAAARSDRAFACALTTKGAVYCWGSNIIGTLGNTTLVPTSSSSAVPVVGVQTGATFIAASHGASGNVAVCAIMGDKTLRCWGNDFAEQIGRDTAGENPNCGCFPNADAPTLAGTNDMISIALGDGATVGVHSSGQGVAWGTNTYGVNPNAPAVPVANVPGLPNVASVSAGFLHACALTAGGQVWCWGTNQHGELGVGTNDGGSACTLGPCSLVADQVTGITATRVVAGSGFTVAIADHDAWAWGVAANARLGHASNLDTTCGAGPCAVVPTKVEGLPGTK